MKFLFLLCLFFFSCKEKAVSEDKSIFYNPNSLISHSKRLQIQKYEDYTILRVKPFQNEDLTETYILVDKDKPNPPDSIPRTHIIRTPVKRVICLSATHAGIISFLGEEETLVGLSDPEIIYDLKIKDHIQNTRIPKVGFPNNLNIELILSLKPDMLMVSGFSVAESRVYDVLRESNIPVIQNADWLEDTPLGRAEWIKFVSHFYQKYHMASVQFEYIKDQYNLLVQKVSSVTDKPGVIHSLPYKGVWYMPGGNSYMAKFYKDAGVNYYWSFTKERGSIPMDFETVYPRGLSSEFWLAPGIVKTRTELAQIDKRFQDFLSYKTGRIYNYNKLTNQNGGNAYWERGMINPHEILSDLIKIFHPDLLPDHQLIYFDKVK
ncbi:MAG: ABC transporter substrate-binding protein [Leptospiraceae bacterium]|nr:ABC transporter substrate-binding protein [Leptospiraceae bacterium]